MCWDAEQEKDCAIPTLSGCSSDLKPPVTLQPGGKKFNQPTPGLGNGGCICGVLDLFRVILHSSILGRIEDSSLVIKICQSSKVKRFCIQEANFWKEWTSGWLRYLLISHEAQDVSVGNSPWVLTLWVASVLSAILHGDSVVSFKLVLIILNKIR